MPAPSTRIPTYRLHKPSGQAVVTLSSRDHYLGQHGSAASRERYEQLVAEWLSSGRQLLHAGATDAFTVGELVLAYWRYCEATYPKRTCDSTIKCALRRLTRLYSTLPVSDMGPRQIRALRRQLIDEGLSRSYINAQIRWMRGAFRWGVEEELVPPMVLHGLDAVRGLRRGRSEARETDPVRPVDPRVVDATLPFLPPIVGDMVRLQRLTGMRPGELCGMTTGQLDISGDVWLYRPDRHKTEHHGHTRIIPIGPHGQDILRGYLRPDLNAPLFSPAESEARRHAALRETNRTPHTPSRIKRDAERKRRPRRRAGDSYSTTSYAQAIRKAADRAGQPRWSPNQLRHAKATELRRTYGLDAAGAMLGHAKLETTQIYAERSQDLAVRIARETG